MLRLHMGNQKSSFDYTIHHFRRKKNFPNVIFFQGKIHDGISKFNFTDFIIFSYYKYLFLLRKFVKILKQNYTLQSSHFIHNGNIFNFSFIKYTRKGEKKNAIILFTFFKKITLSRFKHFLILTECYELFVHFIS